MASEWLRGHIFTGFPWNLYGYGWAHTLPMAQLAAIGGIYWLSLVTVLWAALPGFLAIWPQQKIRKAVLLALLVATMGGAWLYGSYRLKTHPTDISNDAIVRLVQPNIRQEDKWNPHKRGENLEKLLTLSVAGRENSLLPTIIVWPETAISDYLLIDDTARAAIRAVLSGYEKPVILLAGTMRHERGPTDGMKYFNSLVAYDSRLQPVAIYNKSHLVPFGEYIPLQKYIPLEPVVKFSGFEKGGGPQTLRIPGFNLSFSPLVCYEIIFPGAVTGGEDRPDVIVNVTNDAWYGDSSGPRQHFIQAQFRAIEEGIPVIRAANTGISGIIDPAGRIIRRYRLGESAESDINLPRKLADATLY